MMNVMKSIIANGITFALSYMTVFAATVSDVTARQRYPWNGMVDVEFTITGESGVKYDTSFLAKDLVGGTNLPMKTVHKSDGSSAMLTNALAAGTYKWAWSTAADLPKGFSCERVKVEINAIRKDPLYMVVDLSGGPNATKYPVNYLDDVPSGGWTDAYKTSKLVLRRVPKTGHWIGVFEMTQKQWKLVTGKNPSSYKGDIRPVDSISSNWDVSGQETKDGDVKSFLSLINQKTGMSFRYPNGSEWVAIGELYGGGGYDDDRNRTESYDVGMSSANEIGLYDLKGNVCEWVSSGAQIIGSSFGSSPYQYAHWLDAANYGNGAVYSFMGFRIYHGN